MCYNHVKPHKEIQNQDATGLPLDYMRMPGIFKAKKMNEYNLCWFYCVGLLGDIPHFPSLHKLAMHAMLQDLLNAMHGLGQPDLLMAFARDSATAVCLLQELHTRTV